MKLFISDFTGICNRLEALSFAYTIRDHFGHEIFLDWPELDSFAVRGTHRGKVRWFNRLSYIKVRDCDDAMFKTLGSYRNISLRGLSGGPEEALEKSLTRLAGDIRLHPRLAQSIRDLFLQTRRDGRKVVGVHIRRGDFQGAESAVYDIRGRRHPAVPDWWWLWAMRRIKAAHPDVLFYISGTGDPTSYPWLTDEFDLIQLEEKSPYDYKGISHASTVNPVADLFALACCPVILATPISSFSHWAANILGPPSQVLMPKAFTEKPDPQMIKAGHRCSRLAVWIAMCRTGEGTAPVKQDADLPEMNFANVDWLE
jgi:hypothetical protein